MLIYVVAGLFVANHGYPAGPIKEKWRYDLDREEYDYFNGAPGIAPNGTVLIGSQEKGLFALSPNGELLWRVKPWRGIHTTPLIDDAGSSYVSSWDRGLHSVSADGTLQWQHPASATDHSSAVLAPDGSIYLASRMVSNSRGPSRHYPALYSIDRNGKEKWSLPLRIGLYHHLAVAADGTVYVREQVLLHDLSLSDLVAVRPDGRICWRVGGVTSDPIIGLGGVIYCGGTNETLQAIHPDGSVIWSTSIIGGLANSPVVDLDGRLFLGTGDGYVCAVTPLVGVEWYFETDGVVMRCGTMSEGELKALSERRARLARPEHPALAHSMALNANGEVIVAAGANLLALTRAGKKSWSFEVPDSDQQRGIASPPIIAKDGAIYFTTRDRNGKYAIHAVSSPHGPMKSPWPMFLGNARHTSQALD